MADWASLILLTAVLCELALLVFIFCIGRFYELKFKEKTFHVSFLVPAAVFISVLAFYLATGQGLEWCMLFTSACTLLVMMTTGLFLYRKMMGVSR
jgi:cation transport ATPase